MKKSLLSLVLLCMTFICLHAQQRNTFTSVPVVNGTVVFEQFIHTGSTQSNHEKFEKLVSWGQRKFTGSPQLTGMRFNENARTVTISLRSPLTLSNNETITMTYRFDVSTSNLGVMLIIRDISYQIAGQGTPLPSFWTAEETITDQAIAINDANRTRRINTRTATLNVFNDLSAEIEGLFL